MNFSLKILESNDIISKSILETLVKDIDVFMIGGIRSIKTTLPQVISSAITNTPEYSSLINGKLRYEFGIPNPGPRLAGLIDTWIKNIQYTYFKPKIQGNKIKSSLSVNAIRVDFADVLYTDYAIVVDAARGYTLPWLEWLLVDGKKTIVNNYEVILGSNKFSRTGGALMKESKSSWSVPSEFSGNLRDNWITRAIDSSSSTIQTLLQEAFKL